jgi:DNA polymerase III sliding clamp (beta) subunit (PCNA family)
LQETLAAIDTPQIAFEMQTQAAPGVFRPVGDESLLIIVMPMTVR